MMSVTQVGPIIRPHRREDRDRFVLDLNGLSHSYIHTFRIITAVRPFFIIHIVEIGDTMFFPQIQPNCTSVLFFFVICPIAR